VAALSNLVVGIRVTLAEWMRLNRSDLQFAEAHIAFAVFVVMLAFVVLVLLARQMSSRKAGRTHLVLPAILPIMRRSRLSGTRHSPFLVFLLGVPFFAVALADPHTSFRHDEVSYPGRRIALVIDASSSMILKFETAKLKTQASPAYFTAVAAAERFMRLRMAGPYHDLIGLIQFGDQAYVVTPFTTDYGNVLLSIHLISSPREWGRFPEYGTTIIRGIEQGLALFKTFDFLNASGNLMILFSDGRDDEVKFRGKSLDAMMLEAGKNHVPVYMLRTAYKLNFGEIPEDKIWKPAIERTGGRFYAALDEPSILRAIEEIDRLSAGRIDVREYTSQRPQFSGYVLIAVGLWLTSVLLKFGFPQFRTFP
jgi:Ca-activated chloride channel family protein